MIDSISAQPDPTFDSRIIPFSKVPLKKLSLIQVFGCTTDGLKECLLIHGFYPSIYVGFSEDDELKEQFLFDIQQQIEKSFGDSFVFSYEFCEHFSIYGYDEKGKFLRIKLTQGERILQITRYLTEFVWRGNKCKVYEGHIPCFMKFLVEYNLTGCGWINVNSCYETSSKYSTYEKESHCHISSIKVEHFNNGSQILSHLNFFWKAQHDLNQALRLETQVHITSTVRNDLIFTQRPIEIPLSDSPPKTQEFEDLLSFIEKFDPDTEIDKFEKDEIRTQLEIDNIMIENANHYVTPHSFVPGRVSQVLQESQTILSQKNLVKRAFSPIFLDQNIEILENHKRILDTKENNSSVEDVLPLIGEHASQRLSLLYIEIGCSSREKLLPNPKYDPVFCVSMLHSVGGEILDRVSIFNGSENEIGTSVVFSKNEFDLFQKTVEMFRKFDPDLVLGFNTEKESIGYLIERAGVLGMKNFIQDLSRTFLPPSFDHDVKKLNGRLLINVWRVMRHEVPLRSYSLNSVSQHFLKEPFPEIKDVQLTAWLNTTPHKFVLHVVRKVNTLASIVYKMNMIDQYSEMASIIGTDLGSTFSRGSQFCVESLLSRVSSRLGYLLYSPTRQDVAGQKAPQSVPLVMEPMSGFYSDPVLVVDFQSLYPSAIIAYNLDYSTIIGKSNSVLNGGQLGCLHHKLAKSKLEYLITNNLVINTPNDVLFVTAEERRGILPILLEQILNLRAYVKKTMKSVKNEKIKRVLDARQLALKMFAAVSYGYTSAHFTGRMPCVELSDSIVECSRHILEYVVSYIDKDYPELKVLYGDTDSLFIKLPPVSNNECFIFAEKLCEKISNLFPHPIRIKIEKLYRGSFLVNKKRYCGWMYEKASQLNPEFDVKGLEMKRRDSCIFVSRVMKEVIESVFKNSSVFEGTKIFHYNVYQLLHGLIPLHEFFFARELRLGSYKMEPPGAYVAKRLIMDDPRLEPLYGERLYYLVIASPPNSRLIDRVVSPQEFIDHKHRLGTKYYLEKQLIPALGRVMETMGININDWCKGVSYELKKLIPYSFNSKNSTHIEKYCVSIQCPLCGGTSSISDPVCYKCYMRAGKKESLMELLRRMKKCEITFDEMSKRCSKCINQLGTSSSCTFCCGCEVFWKKKLSDDQYHLYGSFFDGFYCRVIEN